MSKQDKKAATRYKNKNLDQHPIEETEQFGNNERSDDQGESDVPQQNVNLEDGKDNRKPETKTKNVPELRKPDPDFDADDPKKEDHAENKKSPVKKPKGVYY